MHSIVNVNFSQAVMLSFTIISTVHVDDFFYAGIYS